MALPEATQSTTVHIKFVPPVSGLPSSIEAQTRIKLPRVLQLQSSSLRVTDADMSDSQTFTGLHMLHDIDLREIFECAHLKFTVSGRSDVHR